MSSQVSSTKRLVSASAVMASGTLVSRILGLVRVMLIAVIFGNGTRQADMLTLAEMVPNALYILFAGGALNTVLVPQIVRHIKHDPDGGEAYTNRIMTAFMLIVAAVAAIITLGAPVVTAIYTSSAWREPALSEQYASMVALTYLTLPQIFFYGAFFLLGQVLNARDKFGPMMWAPIANNVISILVLSTYFVVWGNAGDRGAAFTTPQILVLGIGSTLGIVAQTAVLIPFVRKVGFNLRPRFDLKGTGLGKTFSLTKWTMGFVAVNQLALMVVNRLATSATATGAGAGANVYSNAHLIWILPHSLITVSLATAMLPSASRLAASGDLSAVAREAINTMRLALILLVPAAVGFFALAPGIASLLFGQGLGSHDASLVGWALMAFAIGLIPFTIQFVCLRTFYALEDTRTPFLIQCGIAGVNAGLAVLFVTLVDNTELTATALALAYSLAYLVGVVGSWQLLRRKLPALRGREIGLHLTRLLLGAVPGGVAAWFLAGWITESLGEGVLGPALGILAGLAVMGLVYLLMGKLLKVRELRSLSQLIRTRGGRRGQLAPADPADDTGQIPRISPARAAGDPPPTKRRRPKQDFTSLTEDLMPTQLTPVITDDVPPPVPVDENPLEQIPSHSGSGVEISDEWINGPTEPDESLPGADEASIQTRVHPVVASPATPAAPPTILTSGALLSTRFRVEDVLSLRDGIETWRAHDLVLSRDVVAHVLSPDDPRLDELVAAARKGAVATDSRFLRVLDAVENPDSEAGVGGYIVCEYARGASLAQLLKLGPLSALEAAWIVRELADALAAMHSQGLFHEQVNPDNIIITRTGAVRLVGFGLESAIARTRNESWSDKEAADVQGLARVLYAALVTHWPGGDAFDLPAAPIIAGEVAPPHTVRGGVSPALDRICSAALTKRGAASQSRITTAAQLTGMLTEVLGTADASLDLEHRVRELPDEPAAGPSEPAAEATVVAADSAAHVTPPAGHERYRRPGPDEQDRELVEEEIEDAVEATMAGNGDPAGSSRLALWIVVSVAVLALLIALGYLFGSGRGDDQEPGAVAPPTAQQTTPETPGEEPGEESGEQGESYPIIRGLDFDPSADGGNDEENPDQVPLAFDGDPDTGWSTLRYHNRPDLGGLKPGVGLIVDLGEPRSIGSVDLLFDQAGADVELRAPTDRNSIEPPMARQDQWDVLASTDDAGTETTLSPSEEVTTQYLMVYLTSLPPVPDEADRYLAQINEITVLSSSGG